ncbi:II DNA helicase [Lactarius sanguifluus]|nr:II DNA helicase [Lactarius sanguifluus]KAH9167088.1 II DNA helicase [Lactarius sanguifluus]KAH9172879.1 II DNA helicase [Lactarius sanguifluus]
MDLTTELGLQEVQDLPEDVLHSTYETLVPSERRLSATFWAQYDEDKQSIGLRACLILGIISNFEVLPREFQVAATIAIMSGQDSLIDVGTGAGKTLCMILPCLLAPDTIAIIFSPLKRLQSVQVLSFARYGIKAIAINEDTPNDPDLWQNICDGEYSVLLVQPEQLCMTNGHLPRLARLVAEDRQFLKRVQRIHVDEAHFIYTAGLKHYGLSAFRPAWGRLGEFRIKIGKQVPMQALSGTQPPHIKAAIIKSLLFDESRLCSIELTSNRPNTVYATHPIIGELSDFRNLDFVIPAPYPISWKLPKTLVFHDNVTQAGEAAMYHTKRLPEDLQKKGLVMHYHGGMSKEYLTKVYEDFSKPDGHCRGLDIEDIEIVIQYGITRDVPTALQRGGRGGRSSTGEAIFLIMYEPWVKTIDLKAVRVEASSDPDHPNVPKLTAHSTKQARTGVAMIKVIQQNEECLRRLFATYLNDQAPDGKYPSLRFTTKWCCDRHSGSDFRLCTFFKGRLLYQDTVTSGLYYGGVDESDREEIPPHPRKKRKAGIKVRATDERATLTDRLIAWRVQVHDSDPLASVRPPTFILNDFSIKKLSRLHPAEVTGPEKIVSVLNETQEWQANWSGQVYETIRAYDQELEDLRKKEAARHKAHQKRVKQDQDTAKFAEDSNLTAERIRQEVLQRHRTAMGLGGTQTMREALDGITESIPVRRSTRLQNLK